jgi:hypothetical protein
MAGHGTISAEGLMAKLVNAKKVMNKVETGTYETGHVNKDVLSKTPEELVEQKLVPSSTRPASAAPDVDRIKQSKLPDAIKKAMIENPIPQISLSDSIDMNFVKGAKRLMEEEGLNKPKVKKTPTYGTNNGTTHVPTRTVVSETNTSEIVNQLIPIIENTIRKVLDEKLTQLLTAQQTQSINENLVLKVGDSVFKGKITGVNKSK